MSDTASATARTRPGPAAVLSIVGACCVVAGGLVAAVTGPLDLAHGSWCAAYLVLVGGVTQYAMGRMRSRRSGPGRGADRLAWAQLVLWNAGNLGVIAGTLAGAPLGVDLGSVLLILALAIAFRDTRRGAGGATSGTSAAVVTYRLLLALLLVSIPVGILLSHLRH